MATALSLHIGLNAVDPAQYAGWSGPLVACEADAADMTALARARGFTPRQLLTVAATRDAVARAIADAAATLVAGDILFLSYSGHGGQVPDTNGDETDGRDETWCLHDGQMIDDELNQLYATFQPCVRILVLSDSCHSGTVIRDSSVIALQGAALSMLREPAAGPAAGPAAANRAMPAMVALRAYRERRAFYDDLQAKVATDVLAQVRASVLLLSGCQDNQVCRDGVANGLFTGKLLQVWKQGGFEGTYRAFHAAIKALMPPTQTPNYVTSGAPDPVFEAQQPFTV